MSRGLLTHNYLLALACLHFVLYRYATEHRGARLVATRCNVFKQLINNLLRDFPKFSSSIITLILGLNSSFDSHKITGHVLDSSECPIKTTATLYTVNRTSPHTTRMHSKQQFPRPATSLPTATRNVSVTSCKVTCTELPSLDTLKDLTAKTGRTTRVTTGKLDRQKHSRGRQKACHRTSVWLRTAKPSGPPTVFCL